MSKRSWLHQILLLLVCSICFSMPFVETASGLPRDPIEPPPDSGTGAIYAPATLQISGKTLRRVDPGFTNAYGGGFVPGPSWGNSYYVEWYHTDWPTSQDRNQCWTVWNDTSVRKNNICAQGDEFWVQPVDSNGWAFYFQYTHKYMTVLSNGDVRVSKDTRGASEKFYIYQDVNQPKVYYIKSNANGKWISTDWTGWVVANRDAPNDWERVWFQRY